MKRVKSIFCLTIAILFISSIIMNNQVAKATEKDLPQIAFLGVDHMPLIEGDIENFIITTKNADKVQYKAEMKSPITGSWEDLTNGYTEIMNAKVPFSLKYLETFKEGNYTLRIYTKRISDGAEGLYETHLECVKKDDNRIQANENLVIDSNYYGVGEKVVINGLKTISDIHNLYKYRLHVYNATKDQWLVNEVQYTNKIEWTPKEPGIYVLDVHISSEKSPSWKKYLKDPTSTILKGTYEAWKLKVITVDENHRVRVGMATDEGGLEDRSFNQSAHKGLSNAKKDLPVEYKLVIEAKTQEDYEKNLETIAENCDLTIGVGFQMVDAVSDVSLKNQNKKFVIVDSVVEAPNVMSILFKEEEGSFLMGVIAGKMTKTNKIAFVGGMDFDLINKFECGFAAGVKVVNEEAAQNLIDRKTVKYADSFSDVVKGYEITKKLINEGCDVFYHAAGGAGIGMFQAIKDAKQSGKNVWAIGVDIDQAITMPEYAHIMLSSMVKKIDTATYLATKSVVDKTFEGGTITLGIKENGVGYAESTKINTNKEVLESVEKYKKAIIDGTIKVPVSLEELKEFNKKL